MNQGQLAMSLGMDAARERAEDWSERAHRFITACEPGRRFTAENLRLIVGDPPGHGDSCGAVIRNAHKARLIRAVGHTASTRPERHGASILTWERL